MIKSFEPHDTVLGPYGIIIDLFPSNPMGNRTNINYTATRTSGCDTPPISSAVLRTVPVIIE